MFGFLNRNKVQLGAEGVVVGSGVLGGSGGNNNGARLDSSSFAVDVDEIKKNLYDSIILRRIDIVVSLLNEWFKLATNVDDIIKYFFNTNYCENGTTSPLMVAYRLQDRDLLRTLLNFGADPGLADLVTHKCLIESLSGGDETPATSGIRQLLNDAFMQAVVQCNIRSLRQYVQAGFDVNAAEVLPDGNTYLHWAVMYGNEPVVRLLLESGARVNAINDNGATPLHECIVRSSKSRTQRDDTLHIIETLLIYKADAVGIKATRGIYADMSSLELALAKASSSTVNESDVYNLIKDFASDIASTTSSPPSVPTSPTTKQQQQQPQEQPPREGLTNGSLSPPAGSTAAAATANGPRASEFEPLQNWCERSASLSLADLAKLDDLSKCKSLLWPRPQCIDIISTADKERFSLSDLKAEKIFIYFKPPNTFSCMDMVHKIASSFSEISFQCIHKPPTSGQPYICVNIEKTLFSHDNQYSILVTNNKIDINAVDSVALHYAFFTFMQLCKIYTHQSLPSLRIIDYSDVKYRAVLLDFSQGYYFKFEHLLEILQMLAFYKLNQVHFYVKFSSLPPMCDKKQWFHFIENWFGLMKFCEEVNLQVVPSIDITNDVAELDDVLVKIKEYLDLFKGFKFLNIGPRLSSLLTCIENKNPFMLDSNQYMMLCSYLYHNGDEETFAELRKFDKYVLMEYGLKSGTKFADKASNLYKSGHPFYYCVGSANWNSLLGCPNGCLQNVYDAVERQRVDQPIGLLMCNFNGTINKNPFASNLNSIMMFAGPAWNTSIQMEDVRRNLPGIMLKHGLINSKDGELGVAMLELGHIETHLTQVAAGIKDYMDLPPSEGSIFSRLLNDPDSIDLDQFDRTIFKKVLLNLRAEHSKFKSFINQPVNVLFTELCLSSDICLNLFKFLITIFNYGQKHQLTLTRKPSGLNVVNIGVSNLNQTTRTDLANKLIILKEEYKVILYEIYHAESVDDYLESYFTKLIDKLLVDQDESNLIELVNYKKAREEEKKMRSVSTSSFQSNYYVNNNDETQLLFKK